MRSLGRPLSGTLLALLAVGASRADPVSAQDSGVGNDTIDILVPVLTPEEQVRRDQCEALVAQGQARGEIIVCAEDPQSSEFFYSGNAELAEDRYARETMNKGNPQTPDPCGPQCGIFTGPPTVSGLCGFIFNPCPTPPAIMVDVAALPEAPAGSDAERVALGLTPLGDEDAAREERERFDERQLGLPPAPAVMQDGEAGSAG